VYRRAVPKKSGTVTRAVPRGLAQLVEKSAKHIDGKYCYGMPHYSPANKLEFKLVELGDMELFEENDIDVEENPDWIPFAYLTDESQFLCVSTVAPYGVGMWEHEDGTIYPVWPSIDDFVKRVLEKKDKTPFKLFAQTLEKVSKLIDKDAYGDALGMVEPAMQSLIGVPGADDDELARAWNLYGLALKGVKRFADARVAFEKSAEAGDTYAILNTLDMLADAEKDPQGVIEHALKAREDRYFDDYGRVWVARYLAHAYLEIGEPAKAEAELREIVERYGVKDAEKVDEARTGLEEYIANGGKGCAAANEFVTWLRPKTYDVTPERAKANQAWWESVPEGMQKKLLEEISKEDEESPSDADIARCLDVESLDLDEDDGTFDTTQALEPIVHLTHLQRLGFYGTPESIAPLRALAKLERLTINNNVIKGFAWPTPAERALWAAAEDGDKKGIEQALAAGASVRARGDDGEDALQKVAQNHDVDLCVWLIGKGADPWAGCHGESSCMYFFGDEEKAIFADAAVKAGIPHPEQDPWRELSVGREPKCANFVAPKLELELDDGESIAAKWPKEVKIEMEPPKKDDKLYDVLRVGYDNAIVSEKVAAVLRGDPNIELLPVVLVDHAKKARSEKYFFLNPLAIDCLVIEECFPQWNHIDEESASEIAAYVIDPAKVGGAAMFRPTVLNSRPMIVTKALAEKLKGFSGVSIDYLKR
jgi:tetratricopeptide (TPR) repeat protein